MNKERRESLKKYYANIALKGNSEEMANAIITEKYLHHREAKALLNFVRLYLLEVDYERLCSIFIIPPKNSRRALLGWTVSKYSDDLIDSCTNLTKLPYFVELGLQVIRGEIKIDDFQPRNIFEKIGKIYMLIEKKCNLKTADVLLKASSLIEINKNRKGQILTWNNYKKLTYYQGVCSTIFFLRLAFNRNDNILNKICYHLGFIAQIYDDFIDYFKDANIGFYNISKEEMEKLQIKDPLNINDKQIYLLWKIRQTYLKMHLFNLIKLNIKLYNKNEKRLFKRIIEGASRTINSNLKPNSEYSFPFKTMLKFIIDIPSPMNFEWFYYRIGILGTFFHW